MGLHTTEQKGRLLYVLADGKLREQVDEHTEGAKLRVVKDDAGNVKAEKWELTYPGITGFITGVSTYDGEYGMNINIGIKDENDEEFTVSLKAKSKYGEDFLHKLPNVDFTKEITIKPYDFESDGRRNTGVSLVQVLSPDGEPVKLKNAFNWKNEAGEWQSLEGYPQVDEKKKPKNSDQWMVFFTQRREWVIEYLTEKGLLTPTEITPTEDADAF
jgi:hypothetical protein